MVLLLLVGAFAGRHAIDLEQALTDKYKETGLISSQTIHIPSLEVPLHYLAAGPPQGAPVLLLHGAAFSAKTWQVVGTLDALAGAGLRVVALDLPGYGTYQSGKQKQASAARRTLVSELIAALGYKKKVLVVAASMGGTYGSPWVVQNPSQVAGYVSVSALLDTGAGKPDVAALSQLPSLLVWGELDSPSSQKARQQEELFLHSQKVVIPDAPHPCYLKEPELFNALVLRFAGVTSLPGSLADIAVPALHVAARW